MVSYVRTAKGIISAQLLIFLGHCLVFAQGDRGWQGSGFCRVLLKNISNEQTVDQNAFGEDSIFKLGYHLSLLVLFFKEVKFAE